MEPKSLRKGKQECKQIIFSEMKFDLEICSGVGNSRQGWLLYTGMIHGEFTLNQFLSKQKALQH